MTCLTLTSSLDIGVCSPTRKTSCLLATKAYHPTHFLSMDRHVTVVVAKIVKYYKRWACAWAAHSAMVDAHVVVDMRCLSTYEIKVHSLLYMTICWPDQIANVACLLLCSADLYQVLQLLQADDNSTQVSNDSQYSILSTSS
jgi:hypothetical protein